MVTEDRQLSPAEVLLLEGPRGEAPRPVLGPIPQGRARDLPKVTRALCDFTVLLAPQPQNSPSPVGSQPPRWDSRGPRGFGQWVELCGAEGLLGSAPQTPSRLRGVGRQIWGASVPKLNPRAQLLWVPQHLHAMH